MILQEEFRKMVIRIFLLRTVLLNLKLIWKIFLI